MNISRISSKDSYELEDNSIGFLECSASRKVCPVTRAKMRDLQEIKGLEDQIARDKQKYSEIERLEDELLGNVPPEGFREATTIGRYRVEKEALASSIRIAEEMLAGERSQPS